MNVRITIELLEDQYEAFKELVNTNLFAVSEQLRILTEAAQKETDPKTLDKMMKFTNTLIAQGGILNSINKEIQKSEEPTIEKVENKIITPT